jgi:hypothetical protein
MSSLESNPSFKRLPEDSPLIEKYKPEYLSRGGEHLVYRVPGHPDVVVKASAHKITNILSKYYATEVADTESLREKVVKDFSLEIDLKNKEAAELRAVFGKEHTLAERRYLMQVPITKEILDSLYDSDYFKRSLPESAQNVREVWTHVIVQTFTPAASDPDRLSFSFGGLIEEKVADANRYDEITQAALAGGMVPEFEEKFLNLQDISANKDLTKILNEAKTDEELHAQVSDFIKKSIQYTMQTGQVLALAGNDNVFFYMKNGHWNYTLMDVIPVPTEPIFEDSRALEEKILNGEKLSARESFLLERALNYVRVINGTAKILGLQERIELPETFSKTPLLPLMQGEAWSPNQL